jgi:D-alanyl-D-alanine carboxypeptidase
MSDRSGGGFIALGQSGEAEGEVTESARPLIVCCGDRLIGDVDAGVVPWWSVTKTAMAAAALILSERGRLTLDAPLPGKPFTLRQLLRHDAGLRDYTAVPAYLAAAGAGSAPWSEAELLSRVEADRLAYTPGDGWTYSSVGYLMVRRAIEHAFEADLEAALQALVFAPLHVRGVHIARNPEDMRRSAFGNPDNYHPGWVYHGLLMGPPREAARFMHGLMTGELLSPGLLQQMLERRALALPPGDRPWKTAGYGLGVMMDIETELGRCFGHSGEGPGSVCAVYHFPDCSPPRTVAAFAMNETAGAVERAMLEAAARVI